MRRISTELRSQIPADVEKFINKLRKRLCCCQSSELCSTLSYTFDVTSRCDSVDFGISVNTVSVASESFPSGNQQPVTGTGTISLKNGDVVHITAFIGSGCIAEGGIELVGSGASGVIISISGDGSIDETFTVDCSENFTLSISANLHN